MQPDSFPLHHLLASLIGFMSVVGVLACAIAFTLARREAVK